MPTLLLDRQVISMVMCKAQSLLMGPYVLMCLLELIITNCLINWDGNMSWYIIIILHLSLPNSISLTDAPDSDAPDSWTSAYLTDAPDSGTCTSAYLTYAPDSWTSAYLTHVLDSWTSAYLTDALNSWTSASLRDALRGSWTSFLYLNLPTLVDQIKFRKFQTLYNIIQRSRERLKEVRKKILTFFNLLVH